MIMAPIMKELSLEKAMLGTVFPYWQSVQLFTIIDVLQKGIVFENTLDSS